MSGGPERPSFFDQILHYRRGWVRALSVAIGVIAATFLGVAYDLAWYWSALIIAASAVGVPALFAAAARARS